MKKSLILLLFALLVLSSVGIVSAETVLDVWLVDWTEDTQKLFEEELIPEWNKLHPDIKINMTWVEWSKYDEKLLTAFAGNTAPDIFQTGAEYAWQLATKKQAIPIDHYIANYPEKDDFYEGAWGVTFWEGKQYGVPYLTAPRANIYRMDILNEVGITEVPKTWEDVLEAASKSTIRRGTRMMRQGMGSGHWQEFIQLLLAAGGKFITEDGTTDVNSPEGRAALQYMVDRFNAVSPPGTAQLSQSPIPHFATGKQVITFGNQGPINQVQKYAPDKLDSLAVGVTVPGGEKYKVSDPSRVRGVSLTFTDWLAISTQCEDPDAAWEFVKFLITSENIAKYNEATWFMIPPRRSAAENAYWLQLGPLQEFLEVFDEYGYAFPAFPETARVQKVMGDNIELALNQKITVDEALKAMEEGINAIWAEALGK